MQERLLQWMRENDRNLPWRGETDPYKIWVSEIMLQQTRAEAVKPYYARFLAAFPHVRALAEAPLDAVYKHWEGLGYYSRARNLHRAAQEIVTKYDGNLPRTRDALMTLPGIGVYAAGAIASIAFGERVPALDGNQARVLSRLYCIDAPLKSPADLYPLALSLVPESAPGDYNQALMDLGALICLPKNPRCEACPLSALCAAHREGRERELPRKPPKADKRRERRGVAIVLSGGCALVRRRSETGLLAGLYEFPNFLDACNAASLTECLEEAGLSVRPGGEACAYTHVFTHKIWDMQGFWFRTEPGACGAGMIAADAQKLKELSFPSAMRPFLDFALRALEENIGLEEEP